MNGRAIQNRPCVRHPSKSTSAYLQSNSDHFGTDTPEVAFAKTQALADDNGIAAPDFAEVADRLAKMAQMYRKIACSTQHSSEPLCPVAARRPAPRKTLATMRLHRNGRARCTAMGRMSMAFCICPGTSVRRKRSCYSTGPSQACVGTH